MPVRRTLGILAATAVAATFASTATISVAAGAWTAPKRIPGTTGLANPIGSTAPNGTDAVVWLEATGVGTQNDVHAKVRVPGHAKWRSVPVRLKGSFLQDMVVVPTPGGDFWAAYQRSVPAGGTQVYLTRLDSSARRWSKPVKVFKDDGYYHGGPSIALGGDGTLVVAAYAPPKDPPAGDPVYRVAVAARKPAGGWQTRFLSPSDTHAGGAEAAANDAGDVIVSFIQGYDLAELRVRAATREHGTSQWKVVSLSSAGDSQRARAAIGDDGTAVVVWAASATSPHEIWMSTKEVDRRLDPWVGRRVITGADLVVDAHAVVTPHGQVTVVWRQSSAGQTILRSRHLSGSTLGSPRQLSPDGRVAELDALVQRPDGKAALLYQLFTPTIDSLGLRFRTLKNGVPGKVAELTGDEAADGDANSEALGIDRASRATIIYTRGTYPDTDFAWLG